MPESVKAKIINSAALMAAGGHTKSWMHASTPSMSAPPKQDKVQRLTTTATSNSHHGSAGAGHSIRVNKSRQPKRISLRDALFTMGQTPTLTGSELMFKWWANIK